MTLALNPNKHLQLDMEAKHVQKYKYVWDADEEDNLLELRVKAPLMPSFDFFSFYFLLERSGVAGCLTLFSCALTLIRRRPGFSLRFRRAVCTRQASCLLDSRRAA